MTSRYNAQETAAIKRLLEPGTKRLPFSKALVDGVFRGSIQALVEHEARSPEFKKIHLDMRA